MCWAVLAVHRQHGDELVEVPGEDRKNYTKCQHEAGDDAYETDVAEYFHFSLTFLLGQRVAVMFRGRTECGSPAEDILALSPVFRRRFLPLLAGLLRPAHHPADAHQDDSGDCAEDQPANHRIHTCNRDTDPEQPEND